MMELRKRLYKSLIHSLWLFFAVLTLWGALAQADNDDRQQAVIRNAQPVRTRNPIFEVPPKLRGRVNFWMDIYSKYGKNQVVIHHRWWPQASFLVLDFSDEAAAIQTAPDSERYAKVIQLEKFRKAKVEEAIGDVEDALRKLGSGKKPETALEKRVEDAMRVVPGGLEKYKVEDDTVRSQTGIREKYLEAMNRSGKYSKIIEKIFVHDYGIPKEVALLPFVESSFDYKAYSSAGAAGVWQFIKSTGKHYMMVNSLIDERRDPIDSTRAAARYLEFLYNQLGSWPLALTAYNTGPGAVLKGVRRMGTSNIATLIEHPTERVFGFATSNYYPSFLAALDIYDNPQKYFPDMTPEPPLRVGEVRLSQAVSAAYVAHQLGTDKETLMDLNYALSDSIWSGRSRIPAGYNLKVPLDLVGRVSNLRTPEPKVVPETTGVSVVSSGTSYTVRKGDTLVAISKKFGVPVPTIKSLNGMKRNVVMPGQVLTIKPTVKTESRRESPRPSETAVPREVQPEIREVKPTPPPIRREPEVKKPREQKEAREQKARTWKVRDGDSLWSISQRFDVSVDALKKANGLQASKLKPGQVIKIPGQ